MPIPAWGRNWLGSQTKPTGDMEQHRDSADMEPGWEQMEMENRVQLICHVIDGLHAGQGGRQGQCCSHSSLFLLNLSQRAPVFPSPQLHRGCGACGGWGTTGLSNTPPPSPGHSKTLLTQEPKLREMKQPQKINLFSTLLFFFSFEPFWDFAHLLWDRRIREKHESSHKVFVHVKEEGEKQHQKKPKRD